MIQGLGLIAISAIGACVLTAGFIKFGWPPIRKMLDPNGDLFGK